MLISKIELKKMFHKTADIWLEHKDELSKIDSKFGDGDHGVTIGKIANLMKKSLESWEDDTMEMFIEDLGDDIMGIGGGSAGPLYGTMIGGMAQSLDGVDVIDAEALKQMFKDSLDSMREITSAGIGDKTMMDSLIPAVEAAEQAGDDIPAVLEAARDAAAKGEKDSANYIAKYGRARSYKEKTIGTPDAGAVSTSLFFEGLYQGLKKE